jgi:hypothetical protein
MAIPKERSIVKVDKRHHRKIAQENWGLTDDQMRGMHVHHRVARCDGGTNDASNLYVCSPYVHRWCWHNGEEWIEWANKGGEKGGRIGGLKGGATNAQSGHCKRIARLGGLKGGPIGGRTTKSKGVGIFAPDYDHRSAGKLGGSASAKIQRERKIGLFGLTRDQRSENTKKQWKNPQHRDSMREVSKRVGQKVFEERKGVFAPENLGKGAKVTNSTLWVDPDHPELGAHHFNKLSRLQREQGLPYGKGNRVKFTEEETQ